MRKQFLKPSFFSLEEETSFDAICHAYTHQFAENHCSPIMKYTYAYPPSQLIKSIYISTSS